jgi:hypothetical protein
MGTYISIAAILTAATLVFWSKPSTPAPYGYAQPVSMVLAGKTR